MKVEIRYMSPANILMSDGEVEGTPEEVLEDIISSLREILENDRKGHSVEIEIIEENADAE